MSKKELAKVETALPASVEPSPELKERMLEVKDNMESMDNFKLPRARMTSEGIELIDGEEPLKELEGVIIHTKKTNVYYAKPYNAMEVTKPDCFSLDRNCPDKSIEKPVHATCKGCPMAEFGTNQMKSGKACRNLKPLYMLLSDEAIMPRQFTITPTSLKSANQYLMELTERGVAYRKVKTKITAYKDNPKEPYWKLKFSMGKKLTEQEQKNVEYIKNMWLPVMNNQVIDQGEFDSAPVEQQATSNEY